MRRDHSRLTLQQINSLKLKFQIEGIIEDGSNIVEPGWEEANESKLQEVDWNQEEEDDINLRTRSILTYTNDWLKRQSMKVVNKPSPRMVSFSEPLTSDIQVSSLVVGGLLALGR